MSTEAQEMARHVQRAHAVTLEPAAAQRLAGAAAAAAARVQEVAHGSLFDTEPAGFNAVLEALAPTGDGA